MIWEVCWDGLRTLFFWALTIPWSRLLARVRSGPKLMSIFPSNKRQRSTWNWSSMLKSTCPHSRWVHSTEASCEWKCLWYIKVMTSAKAHKLGIGYHFLPDSARLLNLSSIGQPKDNAENNHKETSRHLQAKTRGCKLRNFFDTFCGTWEVDPVLGKTTPVNGL
jgi:hypothetical protein